MDGQTNKGTERERRERTRWLASTGVALTFEKLRIANAQHGKNCVSSPAAKTTISTDWPKICHDRAGLQTVHRPFWLRHQQNLGTSIPSPGWQGRGRGKSKMFRPTASALQTFSAGCKKRKDWTHFDVWGHCFLHKVNARHFQICVACSFFLRKKRRPLRQSWTDKPTRTERERRETTRWLASIQSVMDGQTNKDRKREKRNNTLASKHTDSHGRTNQQGQREREEKEHAS